MGNGRAEVLYFIKVPDKFLHCDEIRWIESQEKGSEIIVFFFRLLSAAKDRKGKLVRIIGKKEIPFSTHEIALVTYQDESFISYAMKVLEEAELVEKEEDCYYIPKALEFTNQTTAGATYMQDYRARKKESYICNTECNDKCNTDIEIEKEKRNRIKNKEKETYIEKEDLQCKEIIEHLNNVTGCDYKTDSKNTIMLIEKHIKEGYKKEDFISVIDKKYKEWKDTEREIYVRPETLFGDKFESYVNQKEKKSVFDDVDLSDLYTNFR